MAHATLATSPSVHASGHSNVVYLRRNTAAGVIGEAHLVKLTYVAIVCASIAAWGAVLPLIAASFA